MLKYQKSLLTVMLSASLAACSATATKPTTSQAQLNTQPVVEAVTAKSHVTADQNQQITLEKIMSDPDWLGRQPERAYWADDSQGVFYHRKREGSLIRDVYALQLNDNNNGNKVELSQAHKVAYASRILDQKGQWAAWVFQSNIFVKQLASGEIRQLTQDSQSVSGLSFLSDGRLTYQQGNRVLAIAPATGMSTELLSWKFAKKPEALQKPKDYIARQQLELIQYVAKKRRDKKQAFDYRQQLQAENQTTTAQPFYFDSKLSTVEVSLSPMADKAILVVAEQQAWRDKTDIMPNYIGEDGRIKAEEVRRRVADTTSQNQQVWLLDLNQHQKYQLNYTSLPGYNEDVLAKVKQENASIKGETYQPNRLPRDIGLLDDWYWSQSAIQWHNNGQQVAIMLEAWDNKDRWIATVDFERKQLVNQHRLHDDAWINYKFNSFGWLNNSETLYYLSEQSGYAHLYSKALGGKEKALTKGTFEVDNLTLSRDDQYIYFQANKSHPGIYEVYRVNLATGEMQTLTQLGGKNDYVLSPDESKLLLTHSEVLMPPELYVQQVADKTSAKRLTHTMSEEFLAMPWTAPEVTAVPSSHTQAPIYAKVYLPKDVGQGEKRKAVIFNHGAGYLQNSHLGWSNYFREFMFHSMLAQQGYVVMDMDYRASLGYGRDWRTAIYRQMGTPETQDLQEGVKWMVENANVDVNRVGTYGGSYGGFMTFMALFTAPELFQAGAALRPVTDWAHYNHGYTSNILNTPDVDPIAYQRSSPIYFAEGLNKPLLINAPMVDDNVFFVDVVRLVQRLIELEKQDFETAIYPVEPHGFKQPSSWLDEYRRIYKLFEKEL